MTQDRVATEDRHRHIGGPPCLAEPVDPPARIPRPAQRPSLRRTWRPSASPRRERPRQVRAGGQPAAGRAEIDSERGSWALPRTPPSSQTARGSSQVARETRALPGPLRPRPGLVAAGYKCVGWRRSARHRRRRSGTIGTSGSASADFRPPRVRPRTPAAEVPSPRLPVPTRRPPEAAPASPRRAERCSERTFAPALSSPPRACGGNARTPRRGPSPGSRRPTPGPTRCHPRAVGRRRPGVQWTITARTRRRGSTPRPAAPPPVLSPHHERPRQGCP